MEMYTSPTAGGWGVQPNAFEIWNYDPDPHPRFRINQNGNTTFVPGGGNVGIGIDEPSEKLEVGGNVKVNGNLQVQGQIITRNIAECSNIDWRRPSPDKAMILFYKYSEENWAGIGVTDGGHLWLRAGTSNDDYSSLVLGNGGIHGSRGILDR
jgi:hypothetical protein